MVAVREVFIVHVGGTRCVTRSIDHIIQIHARITWGVVVIPSNFVHLFLVCLTNMTTTIKCSLFSMFDFIRYITIQGFDLLDFIIPQQKKLVGIRAETQIALDALEFSKRDRLQAEDSLTTALAKAGTRRTKEARGGDEAQGTLYVMWMHVDNAANTLGLTGVAQAL